MLDPRFLQAQVYVAVIAEEKSFSRAAKKLKLTQGFLSKRLGEIEKHLQIRIFDRSTRSVELTETGGILLMEVHESLRHAERAYDLGRFWGRMIRGPIRIGYSPFSNGALMQLLFRLDLSKYEAQQVNEEAVHEPPIKMESATTPVLIERVLRGELHAALGVQPVDDKDLWCEVISREPYCICIPKGHRLDQRPPTIPLRDLQGETVLGPPRHLHPDLHDRIKACLDGTGVEVIFQDVQSYAHALELVAVGHGVAIVPRSASRISRSGVSFRTISDSYMQIETVLFTHRENKQHQAMQELILFLTAELRRNQRFAHA